MSDPDDDLVARLRRIAGEADGVPELVDESARAAYLTRRLDDEIATLLRDSATAPTTVRAATAGPRLLSYEFGDVSLEIEIDASGAELRLRGLAIGTVGDVEVDAGPGDVRTTSPDDLGWFTLSGLSAGPLRVRVRGADGTAVTTGWIPL